MVKAWSRPLWINEPQIIQHSAHAPELSAVTVGSATAVLTRSSSMLVESDHVGTLVDQG